MELKDFKDVVRVMTKEEFESAINEDIKFVERFKHFFKHDDATRIIEHVKSVLEASVDYFYPNHPEVEFEKDFNIQYDVNNILNKYGHTEMGLYKIQLYVEKILGSIQNKKPVDVGEVSDGYHTFNELYRYSMLYNAAIWVQDGKKRPYQPTNIPSGTVFCGLRHPSILSQLAAYGIAHKNRSVQGFLTSKNRFLTREEASELVRNNNQEMVVDRNAIREQLYSEDLY